MTERYRKIGEAAYRLILLAALLLVLYGVAQITAVCSFHTPTASMTPTIMPGESGLVNKLKMGARIFNVFDAVNGKPYEIKRLPGYGKLERGDVIVFNYPYLDSDKRRDSIAMNLHTYYCKRAVAVAGDTLEIRDGIYRVRGCADTLGVASKQLALQRFLRDYFRSNPSDYKELPGWMRSFPKDSSLGWTLRDFGPLAVPGKGTVVEIDRTNWLLYRKYIEWETGGKLRWTDSGAFLDDNSIKFYIFAENYCFAAGDNAMDSHDSRYFGLVPERFIVGTAGIIWNSDDSSRILTNIN